MPKTDKWMVDPDDAVLLLIDHQGGLFQLVRDIDAVLAELMSSWNRPDAMEFATVMVDHLVPPCRALTESYDKAQSVQGEGRETKLDLLQPALSK